jgi:hypothetical protein
MKAREVSASSTPQVSARNKQPPTNELQAIFSIGTGRPEQDRPNTERTLPQDNISARVSQAKKNSNHYQPATTNRRSRITHSAVRPGTDIRPAPANIKTWGPEWARGVILPATGIPHFKETSSGRVACTTTIEAIPFTAPSSPITTEQELPGSRPPSDQFDRGDRSSALQS